MRSRPIRRFPGGYHVVLREQQGPNILELLLASHGELCFRHVAQGMSSWHKKQSEE